MTKCDFHKFGPSGTIKNIDALCVLGMNIINEKIYIFFWFWFIILAIVTACSILVRISQFTCSPLRDRLILLQSSGVVQHNVNTAALKRSVYTVYLLFSLCYRWYLIGR